MKKQVIQIKNHKSFNKGVVAFVIESNTERRSMSTSPNFEHAKDFSDVDNKLEHLELIRESFSDADVTLTYNDLPFEI